MKELLLSLVFGLSVNPYKQSTPSQRICSTDNESFSPSIVGVWRKHAKSKNTKNSTEAVQNILVIAQGREDIALDDDQLDEVDVYFNNLICEEVISSTTRVVTRRGLYFHDDVKKRIKVKSVNLAVEDSSLEESLWAYTFSDDCEASLLTLTDSRGNSDTFAHLASEIPADACTERPLTRN